MSITKTGSLVSLSLGMGKKLLNSKAGLAASNFAAKANRTPAANYLRQYGAKLSNSALGKSVLNKSNEAYKALAPKFTSMKARALPQYTTLINKTAPVRKKINGFTSAGIKAFTPIAN